MSQQSPEREVAPAAAPVPDASGPGFAPGPVLVTAPAKTSPLVWLSLGGLIIVALAVIFVLPGVVERTQPLATRVETPAAAPRPAAPAQTGAGVSPFNEAQRALQRKEAQDALAELLARQAELDAAQIERWGASEHARAVTLAQQGDDAYLAQDFAVARDQYQAGADVLGALLDRRPQVLAQYLADGDAALLAGDAETAKDRFAVALALAPTSPEALAGARRAEALTPVLALLARADAARDAGQLESAGDLYREARALDPAFPGLDARLVDTDRQLLEREFSAVMSRGYARLQAGEPRQAIEAFQEAATLGIHEDQALAAIQQTEDDLDRVEIERLRTAADQAVANEEWAAAVVAYQGVLAVDPNLVFATDGLDYAGKRERLDALLQHANDNPERLAEDAVYQQTLDVYYTGRNLPDPGPRLSAQLDTLEGLLAASQIPERVQLVSDALTTVTLLRVQELGTFEVTELELKPGQYVAVGTRAGYRDVRQEFMVGFGKTPERVEIRCEEPVVTTRSR